jgi:integrase
LLKHFAGGFRQQRKRIATKLENSWLNRISFRTFSHFKGTREYHKTKDILHDKKILGHKSLKNTLVYTHLVNFKTDKVTSKVARTAEEACKLVDVGFEYVYTTPEEIMLFRKRK